MSNKKKQKGKLTYFLDHPQIKRHKSPGNGESPGFFNQLASGKLSNPSGSGSQPKQARPSSGSTRTRQPASTSSSSNSGSSSSSWQKAFSKGFRGD